MKINELIKELEQVKEEHGNLKVKVGGTEKLVSNISIHGYETDCLGVEQNLCCIVSFN